MAKTYSPDKKLPKVVKDYLRDLFVQNKIESARIDFSGQGDDGQINSIELMPDSINYVGDDVIVVPSEVISAMTDLDIDMSYCSNRLVKLEDVIVGLVSYWIYEMPIDWVNGDGGEGCCVLELKDNKLNIKIKAFEWIREEGPITTCKI